VAGGGGDGDVSAAALVTLSPVERGGNGSSGGSGDEDQLVVLCSSRSDRIERGAHQSEAGRRRSTNGQFVVNPEAVCGPPSSCSETLAQRFLRMQRPRDLVSASDGGCGSSRDGAALAAAWRWRYRE